MKSLVRLLSFGKSLWRYYVAVGVFTIVLSLVGQLQPLFTKGAIDQITGGLSGGKVDFLVVGIFAGLIFVTDVISTFLNDISGYWGDMLAIKLQKLMSEKYYEHLLSLPQTYFDRELTGKIINRMN